MRPELSLVAASLPLLLAACAPAPSFTSRADCPPSGGPVQARIGGEAVMGAGNDGLISDTDLVFTTRITPGRADGCRSGTTVGATVGIGG